jgi:hypothetical protein
MNWVLSGTAPGPGAESTGEAFEHGVATTRPRYSGRHADAVAALPDA